MKQIQKHPRLARIPDAFFPAALAIFSLLRPESPSGLRLYIAGLFVSCLSLFASRSVRIAFARQPSIRHVRGSVKAALLATLVGGGIAAVASLLLPVQWSIGPVERIVLVVAGWLLNIEHIFYEYMYAIGDRRSAALSRGLTALFALAGLLLSETRPVWLTGMAALSALVSFIVSLVMGDGAKGKPNAAVLRCAPRAAVQTVLYPAAALALYLALHFESIGFPFFAGLTLYELCKTPFRRSPLEARGFARVLLIVVGAAGLGWIFSSVTPFAPINAKSALGLMPNALPSTCAMLLAAALSAFALFGNTGGKNK